MAWTLVTGGAKRLGANLCLALAKKGHSIVVHYNHSSDEAQGIVKACRELGVKADLIQGDFSSMDSLLDFVKRYLERFSDTQCLINNVGNYFIGSALNTDVGEWENLFQTNLHAPFVLMKELMPSIIRYQGNIVNVGICRAEHLQANTYTTAFHITKMSLLALTRSLAKEVAFHKVRVNMVSPGYIDIAVDLPKDLNKIPMRRAASCDEISRVVTFLVDPNGEYITGQNIEVAGGVGL